MSGSEQQQYSRELNQQQYQQYQQQYQYQQQQQFRPQLQQYRPQVSQQQHQQQQQQQQPRFLVIVRGLPGSGKSTLAKSLVERNRGGVVFSSDDFFMVNGKYVWDGARLGEVTFISIKLF